MADEQVLQERRRVVEEALLAAREAEIEAEEAVREVSPRLSQASQVWYELAALRERVGTITSIAGERMRNARDGDDEPRSGRDPEQLEQEAVTAGTQERQLASEVAERARALEQASRRRADREDAHRAEEQRLASLLRAGGLTAEPRPGR
jgi:chromosome segregation protein